MRRFGPVLVLVAVLTLLAGGLLVLVGGSEPGSAPGLAVQAPDSSGSMHSLPWWGPWGWFGGGSSTPSTRVLDDNAATVPQAGGAAGGDAEAGGAGPGAPGEGADREAG